jgi:uncharacterized protein (TIGR00369 family)
MTTTPPPVSAGQRPEAPLPGLPGLLGIHLTQHSAEKVQAHLSVTEEHLVPDTGHLHAATAVALADTACGYGCRKALPEGAIGFTTLELKSNHLGTARPGQELSCLPRHPSALRTDHPGLGRHHHHR